MNFCCELLLLNFCCELACVTCYPGAPISFIITTIIIICSHFGLTTQKGEAGECHLCPEGSAETAEAGLKSVQRCTLQNLLWTCRSHSVAKPVHLRQQELDVEAVAAREGSSLYPRNWLNDTSIDQHSVAQPVHL